MNTALVEQTPSVLFTPGEIRVFKKKEKLTVSQWAEKYRVVTNGPMTGPWRNEVTPYLVEPMDTWNLPWVREIVLCFAPQTGKTQVAFNCMSYAVDQDPGPCMYIMPDEKVTKRIVKRRIIPMFRGSPRLADLMSPRADDTTALHVQFINGFDLMMAWATSASELASESVRYMIMDETDKFPPFAGREADPVSLARVRTNTYTYTSKSLLLSSPTTDDGVIWKALETEADEIRMYEALCPTCGEYQRMEFDQISWGTARDPRVVARGKLARYYCVSCATAWDDYTRDKAVREGRWAPYKYDQEKGTWSRREPMERPRTVAFHLPSWYSPFVSLSDVAAAFLRGLEDPAKLMVFVTQHKAEAWRETIVPKRESAVLEHRTEYPAGVVPPEAVALTAGIDAQKRGFWFVVRAWSEDLTSWLVQYGYLSTWSDVEALVYKTRYPVHGSQDTMGIWRAGIDTGGGETDDGEQSRTEEIYQWLRSIPPEKVYGTKGATHVRSMALKRIKLTVIDTLPKSNRKIAGGLDLRLLDTSQYKGLIHWRLGRVQGESQQFHLHAETGVDYARQLLAEVQAKDRRGRVYWKPVRRDNHLLDCEVIAAACADSQWLPSLKMIAEHMKRGGSSQGGPPGKQKKRVISKGVDA